MEGSEWVGQAPPVADLAQPGGSVGAGGVPHVANVDVVGYSGGGVGGIPVST